MTDTKFRAYIGLGSNLSDPIRQVTVALHDLAGLPDSQVADRSSLYRSAPLGPPNQPAYINAVVELVTGLSPQRLLDELQEIEQRHGRVRDGHWGPRSLDLDILLFGSRTIATRRLTIPHPEIAHRDFVLLPLLEIAPNIDIPGLGPASELASNLPAHDTKKIS